MSVPTTTKFLIERLRPFRRTIAWLSVLAAVAAVLDTIVPTLYGRALDAVIGQRPLRILASLLFVWLGLRLLADWMRREMGWRGALTSAEVGRRFRLQALTHVINLPLAFHYSERKGAVGRRMYELQGALEQLLQMGLFDLAPGALTVVIATAYLATIDPWLGVTNAAVVLLYLWRCHRLIPKLDVAWDAHEDAFRRFDARTWDVVTNVAVVKASTAEGHERETAARLMEDVVGPYRMRTTLFRQQSAEQDTIFGIGTVALFGIAALGVARGTLTPGQVATVLGYAFLTWGMVRQFVWVRWWWSSLAAYRREYAAIEEAAPEPHGAGRTHVIRGAIEFRNVRFRYREDTPVLEDVAFCVEAGKTVAIVGESGEGKSTIVELLARNYTPQAGEIRIDDIPVTEIELSNLRSQLAYVPQDPTLFNDTLRTNIRYGRLDATDGEVEDAARCAAIHDWIANLPEGYATVVGERGLKLSAGQRQRIALARAFLRNPRILILDEPTSNLDAATEESIQHALRSLMAGRTTLIIAHRLRTVREADRTVVLERGRIVEDGTHAELLARSGTYRRLHDLQFRETPNGT